MPHILCTIISGWVIDGSEIYLSKSIDGIFEILFETFSVAGSLDETEAF